MVFIPSQHYLWDFWLVSPQEWRGRQQPYHLYYLQAPRTLEDPNMRHDMASVGLAVSYDLRYWTEMGTVLEAGQPGSWDDQAIWTGCVIVRDGLAYMFYTARCRAERGLVQRIGLVTSTDLVHWQRHPANPLVEVDTRWYEPQSTTHKLEQAWRDPYVVYAPDENVYYMFLCARVNTGPYDGRGVIGLARSTNLLSWEVLPPVSIPGDFSEMEVPQVVFLNGQYYLLFCTAKHAAAQSLTLVRARDWYGTHYLVADKLTGPYRSLTYDPFVADTIGTYYAGKLVRDSTNTLSFLAWRQWYTGGSFCGGLSDIAPVRVLPDSRLHIDLPQLWNLDEEV